MAADTHIVWEGSEVKRPALLLLKPKEDYLCFDFPNRYETKIKHKGEKKKKNYKNTNTQCQNNMPLLFSLSAMSDSL